MSEDLRVGAVTLHGITRNEVLAELSAARGHLRLGADGRHTLSRAQRTRNRPSDPVFRPVPGSG